MDAVLVDLTGAAVKTIVEALENNWKITGKDMNKQHLYIFLIHIHTHKYIYIYLYTYIQIYIYIYTHTFIHL